ncbi:MAG: biotin/lipoyl-binding protein [Candidatus Eisenbacteria bacterium]|uniref:Biotin/lipoyl-binding protein n=1 Tax=Eiseniibacteriota bacterium TaxID=2212470 RepID=A0A7Y2E832_UNCEI|nr:biotin/lipoyl-binding protein [Candidatus Eisenbacteria bacterium]
MAKKFRYRDQEFSIEKDKSGDWVNPETDGPSVSITRTPGGSLRAKSDHADLPAYAIASADQVWVHVKGRAYVLEPVQKSRRRGKAPGGGLTAPMPGQVMRHLVNVGDKVEEGEALLVIEAMKMQLEIKAPHSGTLTRFLAEPGETVPAGTALAEVAPE